MDEHRANEGQLLSGVMTRAGLLRAGLSSRRIDRMIREGVLRTDVYVPAAVAESVTVNERGALVLAVAAALVSTGSGSVGSHRSAAGVHGLGVLAAVAAAGARASWSTRRIM